MRTKMMTILAILVTLTTLDNRSLPSLSSPNPKANSMLSLTYSTLRPSNNLLSSSSQTEAGLITTLQKTSRWARLTLCFPRQNLLWLPIERCQSSLMKIRRKTTEQVMMSTMTMMMMILVTSTSGKTEVLKTARPQKSRNRTTRMMVLETYLPRHHPFQKNRTLKMRV